MRVPRPPGRIVAPVVLFLVVVALWDVSTSLGWVSDLIAPRPGDVLVAVYELFATGLVWEHLWATLYGTVAGFALATSVACVLALAAAWSSTLRHMIQPYAVTLQVLPMLAITPIVISIFGFGPESKIVMAALIAFFPIFVNTLAGLLAPDPEEEELFRSLGAGRVKTFMHVLLPTAAPMIFTGLRIGLTLALAGTIVAEFVSSQRGLGLLVQRFSYQLNLEDAFAVIVLLTAVGLLLYSAVGLVDRGVVFWHRDDRMAARTRSRARRLQRRLGRTRHVPTRG